MPSKVIKRTSRAKAPFRLYATTGAGLEGVLALELKRIGATGVKPTSRGVAFEGDLGTIYRANLWLRTAHRILMELAVFDAKDREQLYEGVRTIRWGEHMTLENTFAVDAVSHRSELNHTQFISRVVKDGIVDGFRDRTGERPNVDPREPQILINARLLDNRCTLSLDTSGDRLHQRGYRPGFGVTAPLKETLAAGMLLLSGYDGKAPLVDPMCGSGTILIEGALIAKNVAPGLLGRTFSFMNHPSFNQTIWKDNLAEAKEAVRQDEDIAIFGSDISERAIRMAAGAAQGAGVDDIIRLRQAPLTDINPRNAGMVVTNPPYGERLGDVEQLAQTYQDLGSALKHKCTGMTGHVLSGSKFLAGKIGLHTKKRDILWNGPIECRLLHFDLY